MGAVADQNGDGATARQGEDVVLRRHHANRLAGLGAVERRVVIPPRRRRVGQRGGERRRRDGLRLDRREVAADRQLEPEARALAGFAFDADAAAAQLQPPPCDGQAKAIAAEAPGNAGIGLDEAVENAGLRGSVDADAGVADINPQLKRLAVAPPHADTDRHGAALGEFDGVAAQILQDVEEERRLGDNVARCVRLDAKAEAHAFLVGLDSQQGAQGDEQREQIDAFRPFRLAPHLVVRDRQETFDMAQQNVARAVQRPDHFALPFVEIGLLQQRAEADDCGERRAQFMADAGQHQGLGVVGSLRLRLRFGETAQQQSAIDRNDDQRQKKPGRQRAVRAPERRAPDRGRETQRRTGDRRAHEPRAEADAIAQDHPEIERKEIGGSRVALAKAKRNDGRVDGDHRDLARGAGRGTRDDMRLKRRRQQQIGLQPGETAPQELLRRSRARMGVDADCDKDHRRQQQAVEHHRLFASVARIGEPAQGASGVRWQARQVGFHARRAEGPGLPGVARSGQAAARACRSRAANGAPKHAPCASLTPARRKRVSKVGEETPSASSIGARPRRRNTEARMNRATEAGRASSQGNMIAGRQVSTNRSSALHSSSRSLEAA